MLSEKCLFAVKEQGLEAAVFKFPGKPSKAPKGTRLCAEAAEELIFRHPSSKGFCSSGLCKQQEKGLCSPCGPEPGWLGGTGAERTPQTASHWALSINFGFARWCLVVVLWWSALLRDCLLWLIKRAEDCLLSSSYPFLQLFGYPNSWETACRAVWMVGKGEQLPVTRGMKKSGPDHAEQGRNSRSWQVGREGQDEAKPTSRKKS